MEETNRSVCWKKRTNRVPHDNRGRKTDRQVLPLLLSYYYYAQSRLVASSMLARVFFYKAHEGALNDGSFKYNYCKQLNYGFDASRIFQLASHILSLQFSSNCCYIFMNNGKKFCDEDTTVNSGLPSTLNFSEDWETSGWSYYPALILAWNSMKQVQNFRFRWNGEHS